MSFECKVLRSSLLLFFNDRKSRLVTRQPHILTSGSPTFTRQQNTTAPHLYVNKHCSTTLIRQQIQGLNHTNAIPVEHACRIHL